MIWAKPTAVERAFVVGSIENENVAGALGGERGVISVGREEPITRGEREKTANNVPKNTELMGGTGDEDGIKNGRRPWIHICEKLRQ